MRYGLPMLLGFTMSACATALHGSEASAPDCDDWRALSAKDRFVVIGASLEQKVGRPTASTLAACLWSMSDAIADHTTDLCARGNVTYSEALRVSFATAIDFCQTASEQRPNKPLEPTKDGVAGRPR